MGLPGVHNVLNALAALAVNHLYGGDFEAAAAALAAFGGPGRRWQRIGTPGNGGALVVDDYAHNATKVAAAVQAARQTGRRVRVVFQPHRYLRTQQSWPRLADALMDADEVLILDIAAASETPIEGIHATLISDRMAGDGHAGVSYMPDRAEVLRRLRASADPGDIIVTMGAGDVWKLARELVRDGNCWGVEVTRTPDSRTGARVQRLPLARFTTLGVGGEAEVWLVASQAQLAEAVEQPYRILGGGSNLVIADEGLQERVIRLGGPLAERDLTPDPALSDGDEIVTGWVGGGVPLPGLIRALQKLGCSNLEGTVGIPAQVGGAVWMNAGTRYGEMFDGLHTLEIATPGGRRVVTPDDLKLGLPRQRHSAQPHRHPGAPETSEKHAWRSAGKMTLADDARKGQPKMKTPGCAFKNPGGVECRALD